MIPQIGVAAAVRRDRKPGAHCEMLCIEDRLSPSTTFWAMWDVVGI